MTTRFPVLAVLLGLGSFLFLGQAQAAAQESFQSPLGRYVDTLRANRPDPVAERIASLCQISILHVQPRYAFANDEAGKWRIVQSLPKAYDQLEMDLVNTAEVWQSSGGTLVEEWNAALDVGGFQRTLYCFDGTGMLKVMDATNYQIPEDGKLWGMHEQWVRSGDTAFRNTILFHYVGLMDERIPHPKLDEGYRKYVASWGRKPPRLMRISELKFPAALLK